MGSLAQTQVEWRPVRPFVVYGLVPVLLALALVKAFLVTQQYGYDLRDSGALDLTARKLLDGWRLYRDIETPYPPGMHWLEATVFRLTGETAFWGKVAIGPLTLIPVSLLVYFITLRWANPLLAVGAALYLGAIGPAYYPGHVWAMAGVLLLAAPRVTGSLRGRILLGAIFSLGLLNKLEVGVAGCAGGLAGLAVIWWLGRKPDGPGLWRILWPALVGMAALPALWVGWVAARGDLGYAYYFLVRGPMGWGRVLARRPWPTVDWSGALVGALLGDKGLSQVWDYYSGMVFGAVVAAYVAVRLRRGTAQRSDALILALAACGGLLLPALSRTAKDIYHLHSGRIPLLPLEALVAARAATWMRGRRHLPPAALALAFIASIWAWRVLPYANFAVYQVAFGIPDPQAPARLADWRRASLPELAGLRMPPAEAARYEQLARYVRGRLAPHERFFAMPGIAGLYFLTERDPPTRYILFYPGVVDGAGERQVIADLRRHRVRLVIFGGPPGAPNIEGISPQQDTPLLVDWILEHYPRQESIGGYEIYWRR